jgi:hypothetical protein
MRISPNCHNPATHTHTHTAKCCRQQWRNSKHCMVRWVLELSNNVHTVSMAGGSSLLRHYTASLRVTGSDLLKDHNALITTVSADQEFLRSVRNRSPNNAESHYRRLCRPLGSTEHQLHYIKCEAHKQCYSLKATFTTASFQIPDISEHTQ